MVYPIVKFGNPVLEREADDVNEFDTPELHKLLADMFESMYAAKGVGLAAPQIGIGRKIAVIDTSNGENEADKLVLINPKIVHVEGKQVGEEGCLSIPGFREQVRRAKRVTVRAQNAKARNTRRPARTCWRARSCMRRSICTAGCISRTSAR
jgi:peptide deformylase